MCQMAARRGEHQPIAQYSPQPGPTPFWRFASADPQPNLMLMAETKHMPEAVYMYGNFRPPEIGISRRNPIVVAWDSDDEEIEELSDVEDDELRTMHHSLPAASSSLYDRCDWKKISAGERTVLNRPICTIRRPLPYWTRGVPVDKAHQTAAEDLFEHPDISEHADISEPGM